MTKPFDQFGGWLRFLWALTLVHGVLTVVELALVLTRPAMLVEEAARSGISMSSVLLHAIGSGFLAWYCFYMLWLLPKRERDVPSSIGAFVIITAGVRAILVTADYLWGNSSVMNVLAGDRFHLSELVRTVISGFIWFQYVKTSRRVEVYYGTNAFSGSDGREERDGQSQASRGSSLG